MDISFRSGPEARGGAAPCCRDPCAAGRGQGGKGPHHLPPQARSLAIFIRRAPHLVETRLCGMRLIDTPVGSLKLGHRLALGEVDYRNWMTVAFQAVPPEGIDLTLVISGKEPVEIRVMDIAEGIPDLRRMGYRDRPADSIQAPEFLLRESVMVARRVLL